MKNKLPKTIGLTGGIGSGKTVATDTLKAHGYFIIDADEVSRELFARGTDGEKLLCSLFPEACVSGALDRRKLREIISRDKNARQKLNAATHPAITARIRDKLADTVTPIIISAPLLFESGLSALCDVTVCITCSTPERVKRVMLRDGTSEDAARAIVCAQLSDEERINQSDMVISSDGDIEQFRLRVSETFANILNA